MNISDAIDSAYSKQIGALYNALSQAILLAAGDDEKIKAAEDRFSEGLEHAADVRQRALHLAQQ